MKTSKSSSTPNILILCPDDPQINARAKMIRTHQHKYCFHPDGMEEFYDLIADPHELDNRENDPACFDILSSMRLLLIEKLVESETTLPEISGLEA